MSERCPMCCVLDVELFDVSPQLEAWPVLAACAECLEDLESEPVGPECCRGGCRHCCADGLG